MITFQELLRKLSLFWEQHGCIIHQGYDLEMGAGTFNPATFLRCLGPEPYRAAYIEPCRRPTDGRFGTNPNRLQHYFQYQVILKPSPADIQDICLKSLEAIGFNLSEHDIRFVHDDWESPTLGAWGLGWEVWMDGMEVLQFTYFQSVGGISLKPVTGEITYGLERLATYLQKVNSIFDLKWNDQLTYGDIYLRNEVEWSHYNFEEASAEMWLRHFEDYEREAKKLVTRGLPIPAYDFVMKASHAFNLLDARGLISVTERTGYIARIRDLARLIAESYVKSREEQKFPLMQRWKAPQTVSRVSKSIDIDLLKATPQQKEDFVLEIGSEELPATFVPIGCSGLEKGLKQLLEKEGIAFDRIETYGTPRRLTAYVYGMALATAAQTQEKRGPAVNAPTQALEGFFRSIDKTPESPDVSIQNVKGTDYYVASIHIPGRATAQILAENLPALILGIDFPKKMHWGDLDIAYARPLRWIIALLGKHEIPIVVGDIASGRTTCGHRQLDPNSFSIPSAKEYVSLLRKHHVMVDTKERQQEILKQLDALEVMLKGKVVARERVIPQVLNLVEWPQLTAANFDEAFLKAPKEVLVSEMVEHQKYFPVAHADGTLKNSFIITANNTPTDQIRAGNQKVLSARLSDGVFLYQQDLKVPLEQFNEKLKNVTFQKGLGTVFEKMERLVAHVQTLHKYLPLGTVQKAKRAAQLCKADLASAMVYEFPELQGVMGRYYALAAKEEAEVAQAIDEHWMPRGENAPLPTTAAGTLVSLAEKFDNLIGCFAVGLIPTSSSDPYALRRQALGIIKMVVQGKHRLPLKEVLSACMDHFPAAIKAKKEQTVNEIMTFLSNRVKTVFLDYGFSKDEVEAAASMGFEDIYDAFLKTEALHEFRKGGNQFALLHEVYKRARGQIKQSNSHAIPFSRDLLREQAELSLDTTLTSIQPRVEHAMVHGQYDQAYSLIAQIQQPLATLFDQVKILADDEHVRNNRVALLHRVFALFAPLVDFSKIQDK